MSTKNFFWNFFVFSIFAYYFYQINEKSKKLTHTSSFSKLSENPSILFCVSLNENCKTKIKNRGDFKKSKYKNETMKNLICYINQNVSKNPKFIIEEAKRWNFFDAFESKLNNSVRNKIIMHNYRLCANYDLILNFTVRFYVFKFEFNNINVKTHLYPAKHLNLFYGFGLISLNFKENSQKISKVLVKQIKIHNLDYKKICSYKNKTTNVNICSKSYCYRYCFKNKTFSPRLLFTEKDNFLIKIYNENTNPIEPKCAKKCFKNFHGAFYFLNEIKYNNEKDSEVEFIFDSNIQEVIPIYLIPLHQFVCDISSLFNVLLGFNYIDFSLNCLFQLKKNFKINKKSIILSFKNFIFIFATFGLVICLTKAVEDYKRVPHINISTSIFPIKNIPFSLSTCFDVRTIIEKNKIYSLVDLNSQIEKNNIFSFESYTLNFGKLLNNSQIRFLTKYENYNIDQKKIEVFYISEWVSNNTELKVYKCYYFNVNITLSLIENLLELSKLEITFNKPMSFYYLTAKKLYPSSETYKLYPKTPYNVYKTILKGDSSVFNCKNYKGKCLSQKECIDKCFVSNYIDKFSKLPSDIPILLKWYKRKWYNLLSFHLHYTKNKLDSEKYISQCFRFYPLLDCNQKKYKPVIKPIRKKSKKIKVFLHYTTRTDSKVLLLNKQALMNVIVTSINIWLGLNIPKVVKIFFSKINEKFSLYFNLRLGHDKIFKKMFSFLFNLTLIIGLIYNLFIFFDTITEQNKITSVKYRLLKKVEYPYIIICLKYSEKIYLNKNLNLSGNLLDKLTFSANDVIESITYLNEKFIVQKQTNINNIEMNNNINNNLQLSHFYFLNAKCYRLKYNLKFPFHYFYQKRNDSTYLTINLKPNITKYYLTLSTKRSFNFNHFKKMKNQKNIIYFYKSTVIYQDLYAFLKDIFHLFRREKTVNFNEGVSYSNFIKKKFKEEKNFSTLLLPLDEEYFNLTINDEEYLKFYKTKMVKLEKLNVDNNYVREFFTKVYSHYENKNQNQLVFKPMLLSSISVITDNISFEYFFLFILNITSFRLNFTLINSYDHFSLFFKKFYELIVFFYILLKSLCKFIFR